MTFNYNIYMQTYPNMSATLDPDISPTPPMPQIPLPVNNNNNNNGSFDLGPSPMTGI